MATADRMAKQAQARRAAAAKKKGSEGPRQSKPSGQKTYFVPQGGNEWSKVTIRSGQKPPKGAVAAGKTVRYSASHPSAYGAAKTTKNPHIRKQANKASSAQAAAKSAVLRGSKLEGPKRSMRRKKK